MRAAIVTTCMGRTEHLKCSLPLMCGQDYEDFRVVVVDWSSPDDLKEYCAAQRELSAGVLQLLSVENRSFFHLAAARNAGAKFICESFAPAYLVFVDADILIPPDFLRRNIERAADLERKGRRVFLQSRYLADGALSIWGSCVVSASVWAAHRYNEELASYGHEDNEFYSTLCANGVKHAPLVTSGVSYLEHSDELRLQFYPPGLSIANSKRENLKKFRTKVLFK